MCDIYDMRTSADVFVHQYIPSNHIKRIVVPEQKNMSQLNVAYTGLCRIDMEENSVLAELNVDFSNIDHVPPSISNLQAARDIAITNCLIESVDMGMFCNMPMLEQLNFYGNRIRYIQNNATTNCSLYDSLYSLTLTRNYLQTLDMSLFIPFQKLVQMNILENRIETVFGKFESDTKLKIFLRKNNIKSINMCEWNVPCMVALDLRNNNLSTVPNCLEKLINVTGLNLSYNQLSNVSIESFAKMDSLQVLDLSNNNMTTIRFNTAHYPVNLQS
uniref:Leucine rich immune protein (Coil-less) n=1 Tax=Anopheles maculatus TaxID=74869 RepID=A0A182T944_9DIPT